MFRRVSDCSWRDMPGEEMGGYVYLSASFGGCLFIEEVMDFMNVERLDSSQQDLLPKWCWSACSE